MGLFDFFSSKKKKEEAGADFEFLKAVAEYHRTMSENGVSTDDIPSGFGPFGLVKTNPIPTRGIIGSNAYLARLRTASGKLVEHSRIGSTSAKEVTESMIDFYDIKLDGKSVATIYICPYNKRNSEKAPEGFILV